MKPERIREEFQRLNRVRVSEGLVDRARERSGGLTRTPLGKRALVVLVAFGVFVAAGVFAWSALRFTGDDHSEPSGRNQERAYTLPDGELVEPMSEQEEAEVFAFRAVAAVGLMDPFAKRSFGFTYAEDTSKTSTGWRVGFAANDCEPRMTGGEYTFTCQGLSGKDPQTGNALTDTFVNVSLQQGEWKVVGVQGNMRNDERDRLVGYRLPQQQEPSHWEFPAIGVWPGAKSASIDMVALWVGPFPTEARGSFCDIQAVDAKGDAIGQVDSFYEEPPDRSFERGGWIHGVESALPPHTDQVVARCNQYTGPAWEVGSAPKPVRQSGQIVGVRANLVWRGDKGFTTAAVCHAEVLDQAGDVVWSASGRVEPLWRPGELKDYPYHAQVFVSRPVNGATDGTDVGAFDCKSV
jgi:hypothetical protein